MSPKEIFLKTDAAKQLRILVGEGWFHEAGTHALAEVVSRYAGTRDYSQRLEGAKDFWAVLTSLSAAPKEKKEPEQDMNYDYAPQSLRYPKPTKIP